MLMLISGLIVFAGVHLFPSIAPARRQRLAARLGDNAYQGIFALCALAGLLLIIFGWRSTDPAFVYGPPDGLRHPAMLIVVVGMILMVAASFPTRIKRFIRHPQLTGVLLWAVAHLLLNGDSRSVLVFATIAIWSVVSMITINRRDGAWIKPVISGGWGREIVIVIIGLVGSAVIVRFHDFVSGVALLG